MEKFKRNGNRNEYWFEFAAPSATQKIDIQIYEKGSTKRCGGDALDIPKNKGAVYGCAVTREKTYYVKYVNLLSATAEGKVSVSSN